MTRPVRTGWMDVVYHGPTAEIGDLWCARERPGEIHSVWEPTEQERALLAAGGRIRVAIWTEPIPPLAVDVLSAEESAPVAAHPFRVANPKANRHGSPVEVYAGGEGTSSFQPVLTEDLRRAAVHACAVLLDARPHDSRYFAGQVLAAALLAAGASLDASDRVRTGSPTSHEST